MIVDEEFQLVDFFSISAQRHRDIMAALAAISQKVDQLMTTNADVAAAITSLTTGLTQLEATVMTAISDLADSGEAARAGFVAPLQAALAQVSTTQANLTAALAALTAPPPPAA